MSIGKVFVREARHAIVVELCLHGTVRTQKKAEDSEECVVLCRVLEIVNDERDRSEACSRRRHVDGYVQGLAGSLAVNNDESGGVLEKVSNLR